ncbi:MAG: transmembrane transport protein [Actinomycetota bacterium]|nr:transmembrane transport protein [Actinomycetota bacterium]
MTTSVADIETLIDDRLSRGRTVALGVLAGVGLVEGSLVATMVATEPEPLPTTTTVALVAVAAGGFAWAGFALWRLRTRRVLLLRDRVVGAAMATCFTVLATVGGLAVALARGETAGAATIALVGVGALTVAVDLLRRAVGAHRRAANRLRALEAARGGRDGPGRDGPGL